MRSFLKLQGRILKQKKMSRFCYKYVFFLLFFFQWLYSSGNSEEIVVKKFLISGKDTILLDSFEEVSIRGSLSSLQRKRLQRLDRYVRKVYPLALEAERLFYYYQAVSDSLKRKRDVKKTMKRVEKELFKKYEPQLRQLTISQGVIFVKLIDRQLGVTGYEIIKEFRGGVQAFFWQGVARLFKNNLKQKYDPKGKDFAIEVIIQRIEKEKKAFLLTKPFD